MTTHSNKRVRSLTALLAVAMLALAPTWATLQETNPDEEIATDSSTAQQAQAQDDKPATGNIRANPLSDDPFRPSETISEDLSVPFPVDI